MYKDIPRYKITIDDEYSEGADLGISKIAFTAKPAILTKGMAFSQDEPKQLFFADELKYRICAPVMIPMEIYRCDSDEEYYVQFSESEIELMHQKFMSNLTNVNIFNLEHNAENIVPAYVLEAWIVETPETDKSFMTYGIEVPKGTLMMTTQITDKEVYNKLVSEGQVGYSIEGFLGLKLSEMKMSANPPYHNNCKCSLVDGEIQNEPGVCDYCLEQSQFNIETKNKEEKMENKLNLPAGEYTDANGNVFVVAEDGTITAKETALACEPKEEEMGIAVDESVKPGDEPIKKEELAVGDVPVEGVETEEVLSYTKEEVDAKLDEIYKLLADMNAEDVVEDVTEAQPVQLSIHDRFAQFNKFYVNAKVEL